MTRPPERLRWAVDLIAVAPDDEVLEIGCGTGVAAALVCARLIGGHVTAIDRSATAIRRATTHSREHVASGRAEFRHLELADLTVPERPFDKAFAVNVNLFWLRPAAVELGVLRNVLAPDGFLHLVYETPREARAGQVLPAVTAALDNAGFRVHVTSGTSPRLVCISGQPKAR